MKNLLHIALAPHATHHRMYVLRDRTTGRDITEPKPLGLNALLEVDFDHYNEAPNVELVIFRGEATTEDQRDAADGDAGSPVAAIVARDADLSGETSEAQDGVLQETGPGTEAEKTVELPADGVVGEKVDEKPAADLPAEEAQA